MSKSTPGPWKLGEEIGVVFGADGMPIQTSGTYCITQRAEEYLANARLIALAPELLDFVKRIHRQHAPTGERQRCLACGLDGNCCGTYHAADALIAKADGHVDTHPSLHSQRAR